MTKVPENHFDLARIDMDGRSTILVYGELDIVSSPRLHQALSNLIDEGPLDIDVDMANVSFIDSSGLGALVAADRHLRGRGGQMRIVAAAKQVAGVIALCGLAGRFPVCASTG